MYYLNILLVMFFAALFNQVVFLSFFDLVWYGWLWVTISCAQGLLLVSLPWLGLQPWFANSKVKKLFRGTISPASIFHFYFFLSSLSFFILNHLDKIL